MTDHAEETIRVFQTYLAEHLRSQARWCEEQAEEHPEDGRNARSAALLERAAQEVGSLPTDDPRLVQLTALWTPHGIDAVVLGPGASRAISRFGFDPYPATVNELLNAIIEDDIREQAGNVDDELRWEGLADGGTEEDD